MATTVILSAGEEIDSACLKCKDITNHTIVAMKGEKIAKVECNTCKAKHMYRAEMPVKKTKKPAGPKITVAEKKAAESFSKMMSGRNEDEASKYSMKSVFGKDDLIKHPSFGLGVVTATIPPNKIELTFHEGPKIFICELERPSLGAGASRPKKKKRVRKNINPMM